jgi:putative hemin transport protein
METIIQKPNTEEIIKAWENIKQQEPHLRIRDAAKKLGISEMELLHTTLGPNTILLKPEWPSLLLGFKKLGKVMALTRNDGCVLEHKGTFQKIDIQGDAPYQVATVIGPIEQRVFFSAWKYGFAVINETPRGTMRSFQFFDKSGEAILKVFLQEKSNLAAFDDLIQQYAADQQELDIQIEQFAKPEYATSIDLEAFTSDWENMKDTHEFFGMLRKYKLHRLDAVKWIDDKWAHEVDRLSARRILEVASAGKLPIMIFAGNKGNIQIHQGKVRTIRQMGSWLNVLDPDFNMHLNEDEISSAFVVHKNTEDGLVSSLELFDAEGEMITQFFGLRKPGIPQLNAWKDLIDSL